MPALRISNIVYGRRLNGTRVLYRIDPVVPNGAEGVHDRMGVPETVVLLRWRQRQRAGWSFTGTRLSPNLWRAVALTLGNDAQQACELRRQDISSAVERRREQLRAHRFRLPSATHLHALLQVLGPDRLQLIVDRHTAADRKKRYGTPDLFLYAVDHATDCFTDARFVEVKRPKEGVQKDQSEEIEFLQSLGLKAQVFRLAER